MLPKKGCFWGNEDIIIAESYFYPIFFKTSGSSGEFLMKFFLNDDKLCQLLSNNNSHNSLAYQLHCTHQSNDTQRHSESFCSNREAT